jgi:hypothetical protein
MQEKVAKLGKVEAENNELKEKLKQQEEKIRVLTDNYAET